MNRKFQGSWGGFIAGALEAAVKAQSYLVTQVDADILVCEIRRDMKNERPAFTLVSLPYSRTNGMVH